jgi:hypothetical protein
VPVDDLPLIERDVTSDEWVVIDVYADIDPLGDPVDVALVYRDEAATWLPSSEWVPGQVWTRNEVPVQARAKVGPTGDMTLIRGRTYVVKGRVSDAAETPVFPCYRLRGI